MTDEVIPIGRQRYAVAEQVRERSKAAIVTENERLKDKERSMAQLLALILLRHAPADGWSFAVTDIEAMSGDLVSIDINGDGNVYLRLK